MSETDRSTDEVGSRVREMVGRMAPVGARTVGPDDRMMEDLGYDSLAIVELALMLESEFDLQPIEEESAMDIVTVGHLEELIRSMTSVPD